MGRIILTSFDEKEKYWVSSFLVFQCAFAVLVIVGATVSADHAPQYRPRPVYHHQPAPYHARPHYDTPAQYEYNYAVQDHYNNVDFGANEGRNGYATNGGYRVALPDGRTQIVTYTVADAYSGYVADVQYEGEAHYDKYKPSYKPAYKPVYHQSAYKPVYHHQPAYKPVYHA